MSSKITRSFIIFTFPLFIAASAIGNDVRTVSAKLESATVFLRGAELIHTTATTLTKGESEWYIEGLSPAIDENSLKISIPDGVTVVSHSFSQNYLADQPADATVRRLQDSIDRYNKELVLINNKLKINEDLIQLLKTNHSIGGAQTGVNVNELMKMMDYYKSKSTELNGEIVACAARKTVVSEKINSFTRQRDLEKRKHDKVSGRLHLKLLSPNAGKFTVTISYYTVHALWEPCYDLIVEGTDKPLKIIYKADIKQTTGLDWDKVNLTLSTVIPGSGKVAPMPQAWFLRYLTADARARNINAAPMQNIMSYEMASRAEAVAAEQEAPLMMQETNTMEDYVIASESEIDVTYKIDLPYTIAGNGNPQNVVLRSAETEAEYRYYCAPKLDRAVFLTAAVKNREKLNLLPGKANITIEGSYTGSTFIDPDNIRETLDLTLGQDNRVMVKREKMQDMSSVRFLGSDVRQEFAYRISVINTKTVPVRMILKDQYPLSTQKDIVVEVLNFTGKPHENKEIGTLTWEFELASGKTESFDLRYSVKYPRGRNLNL